jgi:hypothetical protein
MVYSSCIKQAASQAPPPGGLYGSHAGGLQVRVRGEEMPSDVAPTDSGFMPDGDGLRLARHNGAENELVQAAHVKQLSLRVS